MAENQPEFNISGQDFSQRGHYCYTGPIIDIHSHVTMTSAGESLQGPAGGAGVAGSSDAAGTMLEEAKTFGIVQTVTMCPLVDVQPLRSRFGNRLLFNAMVNRKADETDADVLKQTEAFLEAGVKILKLWSAPRGRDRGLIVNAPYRIESVKLAQQAGVKVVMVHVGDPDHWWTTAYTDTAKFGTKADQYPPLYEMLERFPDLQWIGAHMGGDPEHPEHLARMFDKYPHFHVDTSATKWQVREVSRRPQAIRDLVCAYPQRVLFGSDLVTRHSLPREHYTSRYWSQRTLWESPWSGPSPIADGDYLPGQGEPAQPYLQGIALPPEVLEKVYYQNARRMLGQNPAET